MSDQIVGLKFDEVVGTYNGTWDGCYERGYREPRHLPPAIINQVVTVPRLNDDERFRGFENSVAIFERRDICPCCGGLVMELVAVWDFDFDRAHDFFIPLGKYTNSREIDIGVAAFNLMRNEGYGLA